MKPVLTLRTAHPRLLLLLTAALSCPAAVAQTTPPAPVVPAGKDSGALALLDKAAAYYGAMQKYHAVVQETDANGGVTWRDVRFQRTPARAVVISRKADTVVPGIYSADEDWVYRLAPDGKAYTRTPRRHPQGALAVLSSSPGLLFGLGYHLTGKNIGRDAEVKEVELEKGEMYTRPTAANPTPLEAVRVRLNFPGEKQTTSLTYGLNPGTGALARFWLERPILGVTATAALEVQIEAQALPVDTNFQFRAPRGVFQVPMGTPGTEPAPYITPQLDPEAVKLLQRTTRLYAGAKSIQFLARASGTSQDGAHTAVLRFKYRRHNWLYLSQSTTEAGAPEPHKELSVANGTHLTVWDNLTNSTVKTPLGDPYFIDVPGSVEGALFPLGRHFSGWIKGQNYLQGPMLLRMLPGAKALQAQVLPARQVLGAKADGVKVSAHYAAGSKAPDLTWEQTLWLAQTDGRLLRVEYSSRQGKTTGKGQVDLTEHKVNAPISNAQFVFVKPRQ